MSGAPSIGQLVLIATLVVSTPAVSGGPFAGDIAVVRFESVYSGQPGPASPYPITRLDDGEQGTELDRIRAGVKDRRTSRTELVVLLTPTVVSVSARALRAAGAQ